MLVKSGALLRSAAISDSHRMFISRCACGSLCRGHAGDTGLPVEAAGCLQFGRVLLVAAEHVERPHLEIVELVGGGLDLRRTNNLLCHGTPVLEDVWF